MPTFIAQNHQKKKKLIYSVIVSWYFSSFWAHFYRNNKIEKWSWKLPNECQNTKNVVFYDSPLSLSLLRRFFSENIWNRDVVILPFCTIFFNEKFTLLLTSFCLEFVRLLFVLLSQCFEYFCFFGVCPDYNASLITQIFVKQYENVFIELMQMV